MKKRLNIVFVNLCLCCVFLFSLSSCRVEYKLTGASIPLEAKTISIAFFPNQASLVNPQLSQMFTDGMKDYFRRQVHLEMVAKDGDLNFEGEITGYDLKQMAVQADASTAMTRLTITVNVRFENKYDEEQSFEKSFSQNYDFSADSDFSSDEESICEEINELLYDAIFNASLANW